MIYFKSKYGIQEIQIRNVAEGEALAARDRNFLEFQVGGPHNIVVSLRNNTADEAATRDKIHLFCNVTSRFEPNPRIRSMFESLVEKRLPENSSIPAESRDTYIDDSGALKAIPPLRFLPDNIQEFVGQVVGEHGETANRTVDVLRWRAARLGPLNPISSSVFYWSLDEKNWHSFPSRVQTTFNIGPAAVPISTQLRSEIQALINLEADEPLAHELFREAWAQLGSPNLRSALIIGVAALEVGVKEFVSALVPQAAWLVLEIPSPPVDKMLEDYLPDLPTKCTFEGRVLSPPKEILQTLREAVHARNVESHRGGTKPLNRNKLTERLLAIRDVLWLLDYYRGHEWALEYVREETRAAMSGQQ